MSSRPHDSRVGWCPSVATPMAAHDGLLVRIKPTAATISAGAARSLASTSERYGNGEIDLTSRANLQVRGLRPDTVAAFAAMARDSGLAAANGAFEEIRNVTADPLGADDPDAVFDSHAIAQAIEAMLSGDTTLHCLPPKFGFLVDCGRTLPVPGGRADVVLRSVGERLRLAIDGGTRGVPCAAEDAPALAGRLARAFLALTGAPEAPPHRMRELVAEIGEDAIFAEAGIAAGDLEMSQPPDWAPDQVRGVDLSCGARGATNSEYVPGLTRDPGAARGTAAKSARDAQLDPMYAAPPAGSRVGWLRFAGRDRGAVVAGVPRGRLRAETLAALARLAEDHADGTLRMTPWRAVCLVPVAAADAAPLLAALDELTLITDSADPRRALRGPDLTPPGTRNHQKAALQ